VTAEPPFEVFRAAYAAGRPQLVWTRLIDDLETPVSAFLKVAAGRPYASLLESVEGGAWRGRYSILALEPDLVWRCWGDRAEISRGADRTEDRFQPVAEPALDSLRRLVSESRIAIPPELPPMAAGLFGALGYDMARLAERLPPARPDALELPDAVLARPSVVAVFDGVQGEMVLVTPVRPDASTPEAAYAAAQARLDALAQALARPLARTPVAVDPPSPAPPFKSGTTRERFTAMVETARHYIAAGDIFQVVPSQRFTAPLPQGSFAFYRALRRLNPSPFLFHLDLGGFQLAGSSPEILVRLRDGRVTIRPLAGTRPRGATPLEDAERERELLADPKERAEHLMLLDLGRNDVGRLSRPGTVRVTESFVVERYSHVIHIVSNVEGEAPDDLDPVDVLMAALPAGTLSGAPKIRAMEIIDELEGEKRGLVYAGAAGYISCEGQVDVCILLRTALIKDGVMHVQAGAGVVADSDPEAEHAETLAKSEALRRAAEEAWRFT
jgi:anthranilate synthase component 1